MAEFVPQASCADPREINTLSVAEASERIDKMLTPVNDWQKCALRDALGHVMHEDILSPIDVPPHANSAMDGYALRSYDVDTIPISLIQVGVAYAGQPFTASVNSGECIRIMTGAIIPPDCDAVVMQEQVEVNGNQITLHKPVEQGQNIRLAGEDLQSGQQVIEAGHRLIPADLGLIASLGIGEVKINRPLKVAFFSTGDELRSVSERLELGQIYDSNRYTLHGMLQRLNVEIIDMGIVADDKSALKQALQQAAAQADVVITSGGVSVGDADYVKQMLAELGQVDFWKIAMKPGRPLAFGKIGDALFFGLPGNPVSVMVTFYQLVQPALKKMAGEKAEPAPLLHIITESQIKKRPGRQEFQRGILFENELGELRVRTTGEQGSGILRSMNVANCFILLDQDCGGVNAGDIVTVQPFAGLI